MKYIKKPPLTTGCKTPLCSLARVQRFLQPTHTICGSLFCATPNSRQGAVRILLLWCHCHAILLTLNNTSANGCINSMYYFLSFSLIPCSARTGGLLLCAGRQFPNGYYSSCHRASSFSWGCAMMHSATSCIVSIVMHPSSPKQLCCINELRKRGGWGLGFVQGVGVLWRDFLNITSFNSHMASQKAIDKWVMRNRGNTWLWGNTGL